MIGLQGQLADARMRLEELTSSQGAQVLDGKKPDYAVVTELRNEISGFEQALAEQTRRDREAAEAARQERLTDLRGQLSGLESKRLGAIQDANQAARKLAESIESVLSVNSQMSKLSHEITGFVPIMLSGTDLVSRLAGRLSAIMETITDHRSGFGGIIWGGASLYRPVDDWRACEAALFESHLKPMLEKENENGK